MNKIMESIRKRRAYRLLKNSKISQDDILLLSEAARLAPSCFNNQPWRFLFINDPEVLMQMRDVLSRGNSWAHESPLMVVVFSEKELDCLVKDREYYLFDTGIATGFLMLQATELNLVAHPIAGYSEQKAKTLLNIPENMSVITIIVIGEHDPDQIPKLSSEEREKELNRPERKKISEFIYFNKYREEK